MPRSRRNPSRQPETRGLGVARRTGRILRRTLGAYFADHVPSLGAALAFYTTIAVAPLLALSVGLAGLLFEEGAARERIVGEIESLLGPQVSEAIASVEVPEASSGSAATTVLGGITLVFGAMGVFRHLQDALNRIWRVRRERHDSWLQLARRRLFSLATVMATGFLLLVSLIVSSVLSWIGVRAAARLGDAHLALRLAEPAFSLAVITLLFGLMFKLLPDIQIRWRDVWLGAFLTALLFTIGKSALGIYLGRARILSAYGAAGSLVALLLWCYYAAQIVFLGAEFTRIATQSKGGRDFSALRNDAASAPSG